VPGSTLPPPTNEDPAVEAVLAPAVDYATTSAAQVTLADLGRPSTCTDWTVGEALAHLTQSLHCLAVSLASGSVPGAVAPSPARPITAGTLRRELAGAAAGLISAARGLRGRRSVAVDGLPLRCHQLILVGAIEAAAHGWDAAQGAGRRARPIPDDLAARLLAELPLVIDCNTRRGAFADPVSLPPDRPAAERLLGALGRDPRSGDPRPRLRGPDDLFGGGRWV
jgi:uncharacterized protein (TIGR03086 family)